MGVCGTHTKPIFTQRSLANIGSGRSRLTRAGVSEHPHPWQFGTGVPAVFGGARTLNSCQEVKYVSDNTGPLDLDLFESN